MPNLNSLKENITQRLYYFQALEPRHSGYESKRTVLNKRKVLRAFVDFALDKCKNAKAQGETMFVDENGKATIFVNKKKKEVTIVIEYTPFLLYLASPKRYPELALPEGQQWRYHQPKMVKRIQKNLREMQDQLWDDEKISFKSHIDHFYFVFPLESSVATEKRELEESEAKETITLTTGTEDLVNASVLDKMRKQGGKRFKMFKMFERLRLLVQVKKKLYAGLLDNQEVRNQVMESMTQVIETLSPASTLANHLLDLMANPDNNIRTAEIQKLLKPVSGEFDPYDLYLDKEFEEKLVAELPDHVDYVPEENFEIHDQGAREPYNAEFYLMSSSLSLWMSRQDIVVSTVTFPLTISPYMWSKKYAGSRHGIKRIHDIVCRHRYCGNVWGIRIWNIDTYLSKILDQYEDDSDFVIERFAVLNSKVLPMIRDGKLLVYFVSSHSLPSWRDWEAERNFTMTVNQRLTSYPREALGRNQKTRSYPNVGRLVVSMVRNSEIAKEFEKKYAKVLESQGIVLKRIELSPQQAYEISLNTVKELFTKATRKVARKTGFERLSHFLKKVRI